jgi:hypothetical protein
VKLHRALAVSTALALFASLSAAGAAVAAPASNQVSHSSRIASAVVSAPSTITVSAFSTTGFSAQVDGFDPGAIVNATFGATTLPSFVASPTGEVQFTYINLDPSLEPGPYSFVLDQVSRSHQTINFTLVADAVTPPVTPPVPPVLPPVPPVLPPVPPVLPPAPTCVTAPDAITGAGPATITVSAIRGSGYTGTATGFTPGTTVNVILTTGTATVALGQVIVDANCGVTYTYVDTAMLPVGPDYSLTFVSVVASNGAASVVVPFAILPDAVAVVPSPGVVTPVAVAPVAAAHVTATPRLAATGFDAVGGMLAAGGLLVAGAAAFALRRKFTPVRG